MGEGPFFKRVPPPQSFLFPADFHPSQNVLPHKTFSLTNKRRALMGAPFCVFGVSCAGLAEEGLEVVLRVGDSADIELFNQHLDHVG